MGRLSARCTTNATTATLLDVNNNNAVQKTWTLTGGATAYSAYVLPGGTLLRTIKVANATFSGGGMAGGFQKVDINNNVTWTYNISSTTQCSHHDIHPMPNGNVLAIVYQVKTGAELLAAGGTPSHVVWPEVIMEIQQTGPTTGTVVWQWSVWDHLVQELDATKPNYGVVANNPQLLNVNYKNTSVKDWIHMNGIDYNPVLDQIVLSSHNLNELYVIDHSTTTAEAASHTGGRYGKGGDFLYRWGNPAAYGGTGTANFNVVHDAHFVPDNCPSAGWLAAWNNGATTAKSGCDWVNPNRNTDGSYNLSGGAMTPATYSRRQLSSGKTTNMGSAQQLPNGNTLFCIALSGVIQEVDSNNTTVWTYTAGGTVSQASRYEKCYVYGTPATPTIATSGNILTGATTTTGVSYQWFLNGTAIAGATSATYNPTMDGNYQVLAANTVGCKSDTSAITAFVYTGTNNVENSAEFSIFPNPTNNILHLRGTALNQTNFEVSIYNIYGSLVKTAHSQTDINLSDLPNGVYSIKVADNTGRTYSQKITLMR